MHKVGTDAVLRVNGVQQMKSRLVISCGILLTALLAFSILFGASRASAEDLDALGCLSPAFVAENSAEVTEALELTCLSSRAATAEVAQFVSPSAMEGNVTTRGCEPGGLLHCINLRSRESATGQNRHCRSRSGASSLHPVFPRQRTRSG